jgi:CCR4-NOT transcription complex subunit 2
MKLSTSAQAAWSSSPNPSAAQAYTPHLQNGSQPSQVGAPPGVAPPFSQQQQQDTSQPQSSGGASAVLAAAAAVATSASAANNAGPQTPAEQVLVSPADRWGLLGLLAIIKGSNADNALLSIGTDLGTMGLDMQNPGYVFALLCPLKVTDVSLQKFICILYNTLGRLVRRSQR